MRSKRNREGMAISRRMSKLARKDNDRISILSYYNYTKIILHVLS
jgi:hypothetical protein